MDLFDLMSPVESRLVDKASDERRAIGGSLELLPLCNMNCNMCYVRLTRAQMESQGRMLTCQEWLRIAQEARDAGVLFLLLTGGEPLLYPEFEELYTHLINMGFIITINTNGTLIDEKWADLFARLSCRRLNITLYGKDDETYARLCHNPKGYTQLMHAVQLLKERQVPFLFNCSITPQNLPDLPEMIQIAQELQVKIEPTAYMFPPARKGKFADRFERLSAKEAGRAQVLNYSIQNPHATMQQIAMNTLKKLGKADSAEMAALQGPNCRAGRSGFWMNWKGELLPCGMFSEPKISLLEHSFQECWQYITTETSRIPRCEKCDSCDKMGVCPACSAACLTETGSTTGCPEYLCEMTDEIIRLCEEIMMGKDHPGPETGL